VSGRKGQRPDQGRVVEVGWGAAVAVLLVGAVVVAAIVWFVLGGGEQGTGTAGNTGGSPGDVVGAGDRASGAQAAPTAAREPGSWFTAEGDPALGDRNAPVTLIEYSDYQCPNCRQFAQEVLPWLRQRWMADGVVRVVFRDYAIRGDESHLAAEAAHCAGEQGLYWAYHDALFAAQSGENMGAFSAESLENLAGTVGLDATLFAACRASGRHRARVEASTQEAFAQGYEGTPTYLVNGRKTQGAIDIDRWEELFLLFVQDFAAATSAAETAP
jgi:protein-disulfide isomerase